jgi:hypothetical protein
MAVAAAIPVGMSAAIVRGGHRHAGAGSGKNRRRNGCQKKPLDIHLHLLWACGPFCGRRLIESPPFQCVRH